jgi:hypothetical protein
MNMARRCRSDASAERSRARSSARCAGAIRHAPTRAVHTDSSWKGHHIQHWADGGETSLQNAALLCSTHHRHVHEYGYTIELDQDQRPRFRDPHGRLVATVPPQPVTAELGWPRIRAANESLAIDAETIACEWDGKPVPLRPGGRAPRGRRSLAVIVVSASEACTRRSQAGLQVRYPDGRARRTRSGDPNPRACAWMSARHGPRGGGSPPTSCRRDWLAHRGSRTALGHRLHRRRSPTPTCHRRSRGASPVPHVFGEQAPRPFVDERTTDRDEHRPLRKREALRGPPRATAPGATRAARVWRARPLAAAAGVCYRRTPWVSRSCSPKSMRIGPRVPDSSKHRVEALPEHRVSSKRRDMPPISAPTRLSNKCGDVAPVFRNAAYPMALPSLLTISC